MIVKNEETCTTDKVKGSENFVINLQGDSSLLINMVTDYGNHLQFIRSMFVVDDSDDDDDDAGASRLLKSDHRLKLIYYYQLTSLIHVLLLTYLRAYIIKVFH